MKITINDKEYNVKVVETPEDQQKGLQGVEHLEENEGMLFIYNSEEERSFWMKDTLIPLDIIGINDEYEVTSVNKGIPNNEELIKFTAQYVLELNADSGVQVGDEVDFESEDEEPTTETNKMLVLDQNGDVQMELDGGERIFSRKNTRVLVKLAVHANKTKEDSDYKKLGKKIFKFLDIQESNTPQYVQLNKE